MAVLDSGLPLPALQAALGDTSDCSAIIVETSVTASDTRSSLALGGDLGPFVQRLTEGSTPVALVSLGSPYALGSFPKAAAAVAAFSPTVPSEIAAAKANGATVTTTYDLGVWLMSKGLEKLNPMNMGGTTDLGAFTVSMVRAVWRKSRSAVSSGPRSARASTVLSSFLRLVPCNTLRRACEKPEPYQGSTLL